MTENQNYEENSKPLWQRLAKGAIRYGSVALVAGLTGYYAGTINNQKLNDKINYSEQEIAEMPIVVNQEKEKKISPVSQREYKPEVAKIDVVKSNLENKVDEVPKAPEAKNKKDDDYQVVIGKTKEEKNDYKPWLTSDDLTIKKIASDADKKGFGATYNEEKNNVEIILAQTEGATEVKAVQEVSTPIDAPKYVTKKLQEEESFGYGLGTAKKVGNAIVNDVSWYADQLILSPEEADKVGQPKKGMEGENPTYWQGNWEQIKNEDLPGMQREALGVVEELGMRFTSDAEIQKLETSKTKYENALKVLGDGMKDTQSYKTLKADIARLEDEISNPVRLSGIAKDAYDGYMSEQSAEKDFETVVNSPKTMLNGLENATVGWYDRLINGVDEKGQKIGSARRYLLNIIPLESVLKNVVKETVVDGVLNEGVLKSVTGGINYASDNTLGLINEDASEWGLKAITTRPIDGATEVVVNLPEHGVNIVGHTLGTGRGTAKLVEDGFQGFYNAGPRKAVVEGIGLIDKDWKDEANIAMNVPLALEAIAIDSFPLVGTSNPKIWQSANVGALVDAVAKGDEDAWKAMDRNKDGFVDFEEFGKGFPLLQQFFDKNRPISRSIVETLAQTGWNWLLGGFGSKSSGEIGRAHV